MKQLSTRIDKVINNLKTNKETRYKRIPNINMNMVLYLDYFNNFLSVKGFANYYNYSITRAIEILAQGKEQHEFRVKQLNNL